MKIKDIRIPSEHRYLSELMDFLPGNCILNKGMCGCGGTTILGLYIPLKQKGHGERFSMSFFMFNRTYIQCVFVHFIKFMCLMCLIPMLPLDFISNYL